MNTHSVHPRLAGRIRQTALEKAYAEDQRSLEEISAIELKSGEIQPDLAEAVRDTCRVLRRALSTHGAETAGGALIRRFLADRLKELWTVCNTPDDGATAGRGPVKLSVVSSASSASFPGSERSSAASHDSPVKLLR